MQPLGNPVVPDVYWMLSNVLREEVSSQSVSDSVDPAGTQLRGAAKEFSVASRLASVSTVLSCGHCSRTRPTRSIQSSVVSTREAPESFTTYASSACWYCGLIGTITAPSLAMANQAIGKLNPFGSITPTRSPAPIPCFLKR